MALGTPVAAAAAYPAAAGGTTVAPAYPANIATTDVVLLFVGQKPSTANGGTVTTPTGWTLRDELTAAGGYGTTLGNDTGNTNLRVYSWNSPVANQAGTLSVTLGTSNVAWAFMVRIPTQGSAISYGSADGQRTTTPTASLSIALTNGATATAFKTGDLAIWAMCIPTDVGAAGQFSAHGITATGATFSAVSELNEPSSPTGQDIAGFSAYATVTSGSSSTAPTITATVSSTLTNVRGPVVLLRVREAAKLIADIRTYTLTRNDANVLRGRRLIADTSTFNETLNDATLTKTSPPKILIAETVAFNENLQPANVLRSRRLVADTQAYNETLQPANVLRSHYIFGNLGQYTLSDQLKYRDTFTYSNGVLATVSSGNWVNRQGSIDILDGAFYETLGESSYSEINTSIYDFSDNQESEILISRLRVFDFLGPAVRVTSSGCYTISVDGTDNSTRRITRVDGLTKVTIGTINIIPKEGDTLKIRAVGNQISAYVNNILIQTVTDNTYNTGQTGIFYNRGNIGSSRGDNFVGYTIGVDSVFLRVGRRITADLQTYIEDLKAANILYGRRLVGDVRSYTLTGNDATLTYTPSAKTLTAEVVALNVTGNQVFFFRGYAIPITAQAFTLTGPPTTVIGILASKQITMNPPTGWALHVISDISQASNPACIYYGLPVSIGQQIIYRTTTENAASVTVTSQGLVQVA